jgi:hypothetical protein
MSQNVYEELADQKSVLLVDKLGTNSHVGNVVLGFLARIIIIAAQRGKPGAGVEMAPIESQELSNGDMVLRSHITFHDMAVTNNAIFQPQSDFAKYARAKAQSMAYALETNPKLSFFFEALTTRLEQYCTHKKIDFVDLKVKQSIISTSDVLVLKVGRKVLDA